MIIELKKQRLALRADRKPLADAVKQRDLTEDEQKSFDDLSDKIDALSKRIETLEKVENDDDDPDEDAPEKTDGGDGDDAPADGGDRSKNPRNGHLRFDISTSKTRKDSNVYSLRRALAQHTEQRVVTGLEGEISQDIARSMGSPKGFFMPWDFKVRGKHKLKRRDFTTTTGTGAVGVTVESTFIELLRNKMVTDELGITVEHNLKGKYAKPRQNAASSYSHIGEGSNATGSNPTFDQVNFVPKTSVVQVNISRKSLFEMSIDAEQAVESDMLKVLAIGLDADVLAGDGTGADPTGIIYDPNATVITLAADTGNGAEMSFADALAFETALANANADRGSMAWVTTPGVRGKLKATPKINGSQVYPEFVWNNDEINGYKALVTNQMPKNLTKGTSSNLASIIFGNWEDAVLALWGGIDILVNPYINASSGAIQYNLYQEMDTQRMHSNSFVICTAVSPT